MDGVAINQKLRLHDECNPTSREGRSPVVKELNEGTLRLWPEPVSLRVIERSDEKLAKASNKRKSGIYYKVSNHSYLAGIVEQWKSDMPLLAKGHDVVWGMIAVSDGLEPLKTILAVASAFETRDELPITIVTGQDLIMMEQRFARKDIKYEMKEEDGLRTLCVGEYIAIISFNELVRHGRETLDGRGAVCFDLDIELLEDEANRSLIAPLMLNFCGVYYMCKRLESRYAGLKKVRNVLQGYGVPEKGILMG